MLEISKKEGGYPPSMLNAALMLNEKKLPYAICHLKFIPPYPVGKRSRLNWLGISNHF